MTTSVLLREFPATDGLAMNYQQFSRQQQVAFCPHFALSRRTKCLENTVSCLEIICDQEFYKATLMADLRDEALKGVSSKSDPKNHVPGKRTGISNTESKTEVHQTCIQ